MSGRILVSLTGLDVGLLATEGYPILWMVFWLFLVCSSDFPVFLFCHLFSWLSNVFCHLFSFSPFVSVFFLYCSAVYIIDYFPSVYSMFLFCCIILCFNFFFFPFFCLFHFMYPSLPLFFSFLQSFPSFYCAISFVPLISTLIYFFLFSP